MSIRRRYDITKQATVYVESRHVFFFVFFCIFLYLKTLAATTDLYSCLGRNSKTLRADAAALLAQTPYAMLTSIPGIGFVLAAGLAGELGDPSRLPRTDSLCAYAGIVPSTFQSGGPDSPAISGGTGSRYNRILKDWTVQSSQKIGLYGPPELKDRMAKWTANGQHAAFAGARRYLRLLRTLVRHEVPYLAPAGRGASATAEARAAACRETSKILVAKWRPLPGWREMAFAEDRPLGFWRRTAMEAHGIDLPLS